MKEDMTAPASSGDVPKVNDDGSVTLAQVHIWRRQSLAHYAPTRKEGEEDLAFVDGEQWEDEAKRRNEDNDKPSLVFNRTAVAVNVAIALERSQRQDTIALPRGSNDVEMAEAVTEICRFIADQNDIDHRVSRASEWRFKYGYGVLKQCRSDLLMRDPIEVKVLDPRRVLVDPFSQEDDLSDARFVLERVIMPIEDAKRQYPKFADKFDDVATRLQMKDRTLEDEDRDGREDGNGPIILPMEYWDEDDGYGTIDLYAGMVPVYECEYKVIEDAVVLAWPDGHMEEVDPDDDSDVQKVYLALQQGAQVQVGPVAHFRRKVFCGPYEITDEPTDKSYQDFSYVILWCYRDRLGRPISLVRWLKDPQREINYRHSSLIGILGSRRVIVETGVLEDEETAAEDIAKPNAIIKINAGKMAGIKIERDTDVAQIHLDMEQSAANYIDQISGANQDLRGDGQSDAQSGIAIKSRQEQGALQLFPLMDMLRQAKRLLFERIISEFRALYPMQKEIRITDGQGGPAFLAINVTDPQVQQQMMAQAQARGINLKVAGNLSDARFDLKVDDVPTSPTERARQVETLMQLAGQMKDPVIAAQMVILAVQSSDLPTKDQILPMMQQRLQGMLQPPAQEPPKPILTIAGKLTDLAPNQQDALLQEEANLPPANQPAANPHALEAAKVAQDQQRIQLEAQGHQLEAARLASEHAHKSAQLGLQAQQQVHAQVMAEHQAQQPPAPAKAGT